MTPYEIKILLAINGSTSWRDNLDDVARTDLWHETIQKFKEADLLGFDDQCTQRLKVYCAALCDLPLPVVQWVMP